MDSDFFLLEGNNWNNLDQQYHNLLFQNDEKKEYRITKDQSIFSGKIIRVETDGKLIVETDSQSCLGFYMKEITFL
jgi:hypothetical protein